MRDINKIPTVGQRLISMFVDHFIMTFIICIGGLTLSLPLALIPKDVLPLGLQMFGGGLIGIIIFILFSLYFNKDILNGRSPAKRILKFQVVDNDTNLAASPLKCLLRNLTIIIWPIEVLITIFNPSQRLGDRLANTRVVVFDETREKDKLDKKAIAKVLFVGLFVFIGVSVLTILFQVATS
jgi:uncharacterized RDD family membrane protein YckC